MDFWKTHPQNKPANNNQPDLDEYVPATPIINTQKAAVPLARTRTQPEYQPEMRQVRYQPERRSRIGCLPNTCRGCGCLMMGLAIIAIMTVGYVLIARPPGVWEPLKQWLNADLQAPTTEEPSLEAVYSKLQDQVKTFQIGENKLHITAAELQVLISTQLGNLFPGKVFVNVSTAHARLFWNVDTKESIPLWAVAEFRPDQQQKLVLTKLGTPRIGIPSFLNQPATNLLLSGLEFGRQREFKDLVHVILDLPENVEVKGVVLKDNELEIILNVSTGLDNIFR
jgi:hypothetical protein